MILSRLIEHVKQQHWTAVFLDFLIVVAGVFVGLQAQDWNTARTDNARANVMIARLKADFETIEFQLHGSIGQLDTCLKASERVYDIVESGVAPADPDQQAAFSKALTETVQLRIPAWQSPTFVELQSSGELNLIHDEVLKAALLEYDQRTQIALTAFKTIAERTNIFSPPIFNTMRFQPITGASNGSKSFAVRTYDFDAMRADPKFLPAVSAFTLMLVNDRVVQAQQLEKAENVLALLNKRGTK